ncbi:cell wall hydrolase [Clostridium fermenticellae]|uniref:Cell wall hydrolase n=2 Tax=Clostridium fermenticellae TaxID=2068654 RepID=A0A386H707_9CLOT|nr:cell wall hydrolase [Clostridium fermenticellae]
MVIFLGLLIFVPFKVSAVENTTSETNLFNEKEQVVQVFNYYDKKLYITQNDLDLMSKVVYAESNCEPFEGKVAVASVILNRLKYPEFPKTIEGVVTQKGAFSCVNSNGTINAPKTDTCYKAVLEALKGYDPTGKAVFFYNPQIATSRWMKDINKKNVKAIGNHVFFVVN